MDEYRRGSADDVDGVEYGNLVGRALHVLVQPFVLGIVVTEAVLLGVGYAAITLFSNEFANVVYGMAVSLAGMIGLLAVVLLVSLLLGRTRRYLRRR